MTESMTKQEAWLIINNAVKKASEEKYAQIYIQRKTDIQRKIDSMLDDDAIIGQCGRDIDDEDFYDGQTYIDNLWD